MKINLHTHHYFRGQEIGIYNICVGVKKEYNIRDFFSVGIHPWHINEESINIFWQEFVLLAKRKNCIAIGEIGLDKVTKSDYSLQKIIFEKQLIYAEQSNLPVIIHCVKCLDDILLFRKKYRATTWILHDFSGSLQIANELRKRNIYFSLGNKFMNNSSKIEKILPFLPLENIFFETDNKFRSIDELYKKAASVLKISKKNLEQIIYTNFKTVFNGIAV